MHLLPRDSRPGAADLSVDLNRDPRAIFRQTDNGIPVRMAIFACCSASRTSSSIRCATRRGARRHISGRRDAVFHGVD